mmetsp:Transcript_24998/g.63813  ORF Transcript_24998/g.63813 Transcript_24998/m.63813 type:complete len:211 (+) Transcript_24998:1084-1716(+)
MVTNHAALVARPGLDPRDALRVGRRQNQRMRGYLEPLRQGYPRLPLVRAVIGSVYEDVAPGAKRGLCGHQALLLGFEHILTYTNPEGIWRHPGLGIRPAAQLFTECGLASTRRSDHHDQDLVIPSVVPVPDSLVEVRGGLGPFPKHLFRSAKPQLNSRRKLLVRIRKIRWPSCCVTNVHTCHPVHRTVVRQEQFPHACIGLAVPVVLQGH